MKSFPALASVVFLMLAPLSPAFGQSSVRSPKEEAALEREPQSSTSLIARRPPSGPRTSTGGPTRGCTNRT
jgi:hypothetical protein